MKKTQYGFSARYVDIDIARILEENSYSDFIRVEWKRKRHQNSAVYLITERGMNRLKSVRMYVATVFIKRNRCLSINPDGSLTTFNTSSTDSDFHFMEITKEEFEEFYSKLREREERKWPVAVTAIY
jgi:hypothetical protein